MTISYADYIGKPITKQQFDLLNENRIVYSIDDSIKKIEHFRNGAIYHITYYLSDNETTAEVLDRFDSRSIDIISGSIVGDYSIEESNSYINGVLHFLSRQLYDQFKNLICTQDHNLLTNQPILDTTEKYLYYHPNEMWVLAFEYIDGGSIKYIYGDLVDETDQGRKGFIYPDKIPLYFPGLLTQHPYYKNSDFSPWK
jgi:hypothetical protein